MIFQISGTRQKVGGAMTFKTSYFRNFCNLKTQTVFQCTQNKPTTSPTLVKCVFTPMLSGAQDVPGSVTSVLCKATNMAHEV